MSSLNYYKSLYDVNFLQEHSPLKISLHESPLLPGLVDKESTKGILKHFVYKLAYKPTAIQNLFKFVFL